MPDPCELYERLPEAARRLLVAAAAATYLRYLTESGFYEEAARFIERYWRQLGLPEEDAKRLAAELEARELAERARRLLRHLLDEIRRGEKLAEGTLEEARELARRLYLVAARLAGREAEALRRLADALSDVAYRLYKLPELRETLDYLSSVLAGSLYTLPRIIEESAQQLMVNPLLHRSVEARVAEWASRVKEAAGRLRELAAEARGLAERCVTDWCRRVFEELAKQAESLAKQAEAMVPVAESLSHVIDRALAAVGAAKSLVDAVRQGVNPYRLAAPLRITTVMVLSALSAVRRLLERLPSLEALGGYAARLAAIVRGYAASLEKMLSSAYNTLAEIAAPYDKLWEEFVEATRAAGYTPPARPKVPIPEPERWIMDRVALLEEIIRGLEERGREAIARGGILSALATAFQEASAYITKHLLNIIGGTIGFAREAIETHIAQLMDILHGDIRRAVEREVKLLEDALRGVVETFTGFHNPLDAFYFLFTLGLLTALTARLGAPLPRLLSRIPVVRMLVGERITPFTLVDIAAPEVSLLFRGAEEALSRLAARVADVLRRVAERLGRGERPEVAIAELGRELGGLYIEARSPESLRVIREALERALRERLPPELATVVAERVVARLAELARRGTDVSKLIEAAREELGSVVELPHVISRILGLRSLEELATRLLEEYRRAVQEARIEGLSEAVRLLENIRRVYEEAKRLENELSRVKRVIARLSPEAARRLEELARRLEEGNIEVIERLERVLREASGLLSRFEELRARLAEAVRRYLGDEEAARRVLRAATPSEAIAAVLEALERHPGAPLAAIDALVKTLRALIPVVEREAARLSQLLGVKLEIRYRIPEELAKRVYVDLSKLPEEARRLVVEAAGSTMVTLADLPRVLVKLAQLAQRQPLGYLMALRRAMSVITRLAREAERLAVDAGLEKLAAEIRESLKVLGETVERRIRYVLERYRPFIETLRELAEWLRAVGAEDAARLVEDAIRELPRTENVYRLLTGLRARLRALLKRRLPGPLLERLRRLAERMEKVGGLEWLARDILAVLREVGGPGGVAIRVKGFEVRCLRALDEEAARALAKLAEAPTASWSIEVAGIPFRVERSVRLEPGRTTIEYRVVGPGGFWATLRIVTELVCEHGECYARRSEILAFDPRANEPVRALLEKALEEALLSDRELASIASRIIVLERTPERLSDIIESIAERLRAEAARYARLLSQRLPPHALLFVDLLGTARIGSIERTVEILDNVVRILYTMGGRRGWIEFRPGGVRFGGDLLILLKGLSVDEEVRARLARILPPPERPKVHANIPGVGRVAVVEPETLILQVVHWGAEPLGAVTIEGSAYPLVRLPSGTVEIIAPREKVGELIRMYGTVKLPPATGVEVKYVQAPAAPPPRVARAPPEKLPPVKVRGEIKLGRVRAARPVAEVLVF